MFQLYDYLEAGVKPRQEAIIKFLLLFYVLIISELSLAVTANNISVVEKNGIYNIEASAELGVDAEYVREVLTDYAHLYRLNQSVIESEILKSPVDGNTRVRSRLLCCASFFCTEVERVDEISELESGQLMAVIIPEKSDFHSGEALWTIKSTGDRTVLVYSAAIEPGFFIPPVIGTGIVIQNMRKEFEMAFERIEKIARIHEERDWNEELHLFSADTTETSMPCDQILSSSMP